MAKGPGLLLARHRYTSGVQAPSHEAITATGHAAPCRQSSRLLGRRQRSRGLARTKPLNSGMERDQSPPKCDTIALTVQVTVNPKTLLASARRNTRAAARKVLPVRYVSYTRITSLPLTASTKDESSGSDSDSVFTTIFFVIGTPSLVTSSAAIVPSWSLQLFSMPGTTAITDALAYIG